MVEIGISFIACSGDGYISVIDNRSPNVAIFECAETTLFSDGYWGRTIQHWPGNLVLRHRLSQSEVLSQNGRQGTRAAFFGLRIGFRPSWQAPCPTRLCVNILRRHGIEPDPEKAKSAPVGISSVETPALVCRRLLVFCGTPGAIRSKRSARASRPCQEKLARRALTGSKSIVNPNAAEKVGTSALAVFSCATFRGSTSLLPFVINSADRFQRSRKPQARNGSQEDRDFAWREAQASATIRAE